MSGPSGEDRKRNARGAEISVRIHDLPAEATSARAFASLIAPWPEPEPAPEQESAPEPGKPAAQKTRNAALSQEAIRRIADRAELASAKRSGPR